MAHAGSSGPKAGPTPSTAAGQQGSDSDQESTASRTSSLPALSRATAPDWISVNFPPYAVVNDLPSSKRKALFAELDQEVLCPGMAEQVYRGPRDSRAGEQPSSSWLQQVRGKLSHVLHRGEPRFSRERSPSPQRKGRSKSYPQKQVCLRENIEGDLTVTSASEGEDSPLDLRTYNFPRLRKELNALRKTGDQTRSDSPVRRSDDNKRGRLESIIQRLPSTVSQAVTSHGISVSVPQGTTSQPPPYCDTQIPLIASTIYDDDGFMYVSRHGRTVPEMRSLMKQATQRGDEVTVSNLADEIDETIHEYQHGLSSVERKRRMDSTCCGSQPRAQTDSGDSATNVSQAGHCGPHGGNSRGNPNRSSQRAQQCSGCIDEQVTSKDSEVSRSVQATHDCEGFFLVSDNGRSIDELQGLIQRAASVGNDILRQKLMSEMQRTIVEFRDNLLSEEQKLIRIENYVAGKQIAPSAQHGHTYQGPPATQSAHWPRAARHRLRGTRDRDIDTGERLEPRQPPIIQTTICASSSSDSSDSEQGKPLSSEPSKLPVKPRQQHYAKQLSSNTVAMSATVLSKIPKFKPTSKISWLELVQAQLQQTDLTDTQKISLLCDKIPDQHMDVIAQEVKARVSFDEVCATLRKHFQVPDRVKIKVLQRKIKLKDQTPSEAMRHALAEADIPTNPTGTFGSWVKEAFIKAMPRNIQNDLLQEARERPHRPSASLVELMDLADDLYANIASSDEERQTDKKASTIDTSLADNLFTSINAVAREVRQLKEAASKSGEASKPVKKSTEKLALHTRGATESSSATSSDSESADGEQTWHTVTDKRYHSQGKRGSFLHGQSRDKNQRNDSTSSVVQGTLAQMGLVAEGEQMPEKAMRRIVQETVAQLGVTTGNVPNQPPTEPFRQRYPSNTFSRPCFNQPNSQGRCHYCGIVGHFWRQCRKRLRAQSPRWPQNHPFTWMNQQGGQHFPWQFPTPPTAEQSSFSQYGQTQPSLMIAPPPTGLAVVSQQSPNAQDQPRHPARGH